MLNTTNPRLKLYYNITGNVVLILVSANAYILTDKLIGDLIVKGKRVVIGATNFAANAFRHEASRKPNL